MKNQAYDLKNTENYEANTLKINNALLQIEHNPKLKATIAQLCKLTGIHRNTIRNRFEPIEKLKEIKEARIKKAKQKKEKLALNSAENEISPEKLLIQARAELIYWFNEYQNMKNQCDHFELQYKEMKQSKDYYKKLYKTDQNLLLEAEKEIKKLKELLKFEGIYISPLKH